MIADTKTAKEIRKSWTGIDVLRGKLQRGIMGSLVSGGISVIFIADAAHNLPLVHAYSLLNDTLEQLAKEGKFSCKSIFLGRLLKASKNKLHWIDFDLIAEGAKRRNDVAHKGAVLSRKDCWKYIDAIKDQLLKWDILSLS